MTAAVILSILLPALFWGEPWLAKLLAVAIFSVGAWEWARLAGWNGVKAWCFAAICAVFMVVLDRMFPVQSLIVVGGASLFFWCWAAVFGLRQGVPGLLRQRSLLSVLLGILLLSATWVGVSAALKLGPWFLISVMSVVWISDISAYFAGRLFGKHKLAPGISPGKTWEGVLGAMVLTLGVGVVLGYAEFSGVPNFYALVFHRAGLLGGLLILVAMVALGIVGDLYESLLKRRAGVKDSSHLLPGHGGILDRIDALLPTLPAALFFEYLTR